MTADDQRALYDFLETAAGHLDGYRNIGPIPEFRDIADATADASACAYGSLDALANAVRSCSACRLCETRTNAVPGEGPAPGTPVPVLIVGEGPGADEDAQGRPFVGKAGQLLDKMLAAISLSRGTNCYIANVVKCRPPQNREPAPDEAAACRPFLDAQIDLIRPRAIIALGRTAAQNILSTTEGITRLRGRFFEYRGIPVLPTYHPSALLRDETLKRPAWEDLKRFRARLDELLADGEP